MEQEIKTKHFLKSTTIHGAIINIISILIVLASIHKHGDPYIEAGLISALLSNGIVAYGRFKAKERLTVKPKGRKNVQEPPDNSINGN